MLKNIILLIIMVTIIQSCESKEEMRNNNLDLIGVWDEEISSATTSATQNTIMQFKKNCVVSSSNITVNPLIHQLCTKKKE